MGKVTDLEVDEEETLWPVVCEGFDADQMSKQELAWAWALVCHPLLNTTGDLHVSEVSSFVWFSENQTPTLGRVTEVDPTNPRPVVLQRHVPQSNATRLHLVWFQSVRAEDN